MKFFHPLLTFLFHLNFFGPFVMGILDSSFLVLPFGNDLIVVGLVAQKHHNVWIYVLSAAIGSTVGAALLAATAKKLGDAKIHQVAGEKRYKRLHSWIDRRAALSIAAGALAPPPFPYTLVIAAAGALDYSLPRLLLTNFLARAARFTLLAWLALKFGKQVIAVSQSPIFRWTMVGFVILCLAATAFSLWQWFHTRGKGTGAGARPEPA